MFDQFKPVIARRNTEHGSGIGRQRWVVERTNSWLHQMNRLLVRYERRAEILEATRNGPSDGIILTDLEPDLGEDDTDDESIDETKMDSEEVGETDSSVTMDEADMDEDDVQDELDDDTIDDRRFGISARTRVVPQPAPRLRDASTSVLTSIDRMPASRARNVNGRASTQ